MFGLKQKPKKLDSRIRYQHSEFTRKLDRARHYKRTPAPRSADEGGWDFLQKLGLKTRFSRVAALVVAAALVYLVFVPNFLSAKTIAVQGAGGDQAAAIRADVQSYINRAPFYNPQHNLVFLSPAALSRALLADPAVYKILSIKRNLLSRSITVSVQLKTQLYTVNSGGALYAVYNDGTVQSQLPADKPEAWLAQYPGTIKIKDDSRASSLSPGQKYLGDNLLAQLGQLQNNFQAVTSREIDYFEIPQVVVETQAPPAENPPAGQPDATPAPETQTEPALPLAPVEIYVYAKKQIPNYKGPAPDFKVIFDATQGDFGDALNKLSLLLSQTAPDRYNKLVYIDMRFANRGFICLTNTPCAVSSLPLPTLVLPVAPPAATQPPATSTNTKNP